MDIIDIEIIERIKQEIKVLKELRERHPRDEKLIDSLLVDYEEKMREIQKKEKLNNDL